MSPFGVPAMRSITYPMPAADTEPSTFPPWSPTYTTQAASSASEKAPPPTQRRSAAWSAATSSANATWARGFTAASRERTPPAGSRPAAPRR